MSTDETSVRFSRLVSTLAEDTLFVLAGDEGAVASPPFDALARRRADVYASVLRGEPRSSMVSSFDAWVVDLARAMAPIAAPDWLPMASVIRARVTLEAGARGLRSLFSDRPSDKEVLRVTRLGTLAVRLLRQVLAANTEAASPAASLDDARIIGALVASLGLPVADSATLLHEPVAPVLMVDADVEPKVLSALVAGAWLAAAAGGLDPREEEVIRGFASQAGITVEEVEAARAQALAQIEVKRVVGHAVVDYTRTLLADRVPGAGDLVPSRLGLLVLPRRYREEGLAPVAHKSPVVLAKRYLALTSDERTRVLGMTWAAALYEDPSLGRQALLRARFEHIAEDLESDGRSARTLVTGWMSEVLATTAKELSARPSPEPQ